jgi:hypothetical protein
MAADERDELRFQTGRKHKAGEEAVGSFKN